MGDEEPAAEPAAAEPEVVVSPRPVPAEEGAVTAAEVGAWCGMSSAAAPAAATAQCQRVPQQQPWSRPQPQACR